MDYDVLILGGGILGCSIAYELSKYSLNIALIEKEYDIANDVFPINTSIVFDGIESPNDNLGLLESEGNKFLDDLSSKFNVPFRRINSIFLPLDKSNEKVINKVYNNSLKRNLEGIELKENISLYNIDRNKAVVSKNTAIISQYDLAISYGEIAFENGVKFKLEENVIDIQKISNGYKVITNKNKFKCRMVINTTPYNYSIDSNDILIKSNNDNKNVRYLFIDKKFNLQHILFLLDDDSAVIITPTFENNTMIAVYGKDDNKIDHLMSIVSNLIGEIDKRYIRNFYENSFYDDNIIIDDSKVNRGYIKILGKNYAMISMTPYISKKVCDIIINKIKCKPNKDFKDKRRDFYRFRDLSDEERTNIININKKYGKIICNCNMITEGEIIDCIRRPLGARTLEGIKRRTGAAYGECQGSNCIHKIITILARETNKSVQEIVNDSKNSKILLNRIKEFDNI